MAAAARHSICDDLLGASRLLLKRSGLVVVDGGNFQLRFATEREFEKWLQGEYNGDTYGRYHSWMQLVVGGENLVKAWGICTKRTPPGLPKKCRVYSPPPTSSVQSWIDDVARGVKSQTKVDNFGALGPWVKLLQNEPVKLKAGAMYLAECRNREAHQYVAAMRATRYPALSLLLLPFFKQLVHDLLSNGHSLV